MMTLKEVGILTIRKEAGGCVAVIGSMSQAMRAQSVLGNAAIPSDVTKLEASARSRGCVFGVRYSCAQENNVRTILAASRVPVKEWTREV